MPSTRVSTGEWARGSETVLIEAVQSATLATLKVPDWDRDIVLDIYDNARRIVPTGRSERYTRIEVSLFSGRTIETKRAFYKALVDGLEALGVPRDEVKIILNEIPAENWGLRGGVPASELDLGFRIDI